MSSALIGSGVGNFTGYVHCNLPFYTLATVVIVDGKGAKELNQLCNIICGRDFKTRLLKTKDPEGM